MFEVTDVFLIMFRFYHMYILCLELKVWKNVSVLLVSFPVPENIR